jgi:hypothetical protein
LESLERVLRVFPVRAESETAVKVDVDGDIDAGEDGGRELDDCVLQGGLLVFPDAPAATDGLFEGGVAEQRGLEDDGPGEVAVGGGFEDSGDGFEESTVFGCAGVGIGEVAGGLGFRAVALFTSCQLLSGKLKIGMKLTSGTL